MNATQLDRIEAMLRQLIAQTGPRRPGDDEKIYKDPKEKYWQGDSFIGSSLSECPSEYLRAYAKYKGACAWANRKEGDPAKEKYAVNDERSAKLASAWAEYRDATGEAIADQVPVMEATATATQEDESGDIPF